MNNFNKIVAASVIALTSASASAAEVTAGGITWDETSRNNGITGGVELQAWYTNSGLVSSAIASADIAAGDEFVGVGEFYKFEDTRTTSFGTVDSSACASCELTFSFGGLILQADGTYNTDAGFFNVYFDDVNTSTSTITIPGPSTITIPYPGDFGENLPGTTVSSTAYNQITEATNGDLWASFAVDSYTQTPNALGNFGEFELSIIGGMADVIAALDFNDLISDIVLTTSELTLDPAGYTGAANGQFANHVPAPTTLAIFGLGLLGLARLRKA